MHEFNAERTLREVQERTAQFAEGSKFVPVATAIIAVLAALAMLFSNHSSVLGLQHRTQAGIMQTKAADSYAYYESKRIKAEINQALLQAGLIATAQARKAMRSRIDDETAQSAGILKKAQSLEVDSESELEQAESHMRAYEMHEVAATLFEVAIVLVSIMALSRRTAGMRRTPGIAVVAALATLSGLGFFVAGFLR